MKPRVDGLLVATEMLLSAGVVVRRSRRGGNRLPPDRYPRCGPRYERSRSFGPDPEVRDKWLRGRMRQAIRLAQERGELSLRLAVVLERILEHVTNDTLVVTGPEDGPVCSGWWKLATIHKMVYRGPDDVVSVNGEDDSDENRCARTACGWMAELGGLGWVERVHRQRIVNGVPCGTSNLWRIRMPDHIRDALREASDARRAEKRAATPTSGRVTPRGSRGGGGHRSGDLVNASAVAAHAFITSHDRRRDAPCPACNGDRVIETAGGAVQCETCRGSGIKDP
jgi:hypothetical protein